MTKYEKIKQQEAEKLKKAIGHLIYSYEIVKNISNEVAELNDEDLSKFLEKMRELYPKLLTIKDKI